MSTTIDLRTWSKLAAVLLGVSAGTACAPSDELTDRPAESGSAIVNGQTNPGDPAVVYLDVGCSGTLVSPKVVLTACHCVENRSSTNVFFGTNINQAGTWISSADIEILNPNQCVGDGDIAMITLAQPGPAEPIPVNDRDLGPFLGDDVRLVGFGVVGGNSGGSGTKRQGPTKLHDLDSGVMWVGGQSAGFCYGDSGGPNFMLIDDVEHVAGVTSFTTANCSGVGNDGSARTDKYFSFISGYIDEHDPATCAEDGRCAAGCTSVDPDCPCADDGFCTELCTDLSSDVDCDGCDADGVCREDCPTLDSDCCAADGDCFEGCGSQDPDCAPDDDPLDGEGGGGAIDDDDDPGTTPSHATGDALDDGGLSGSVTCAATQRHTNGWDLLWVALAACCLRRRQR